MPKMTGAQVMAEMLKGYGVTHTFLVPAVLRRSMAEMEERTSIARIQTHGEKSAAYMADGYARAGRKPGVCMAQVFQPVCLQHCPQFQLVRGQCHGVNRIVYGGACVEAGAAVLCVNFGIFAGDNPRFGGFLLRFEFRRQFGDFFGIGAIALGALHVKRVAYPVDLRQNRLLLFIVFGADSLRAFEQHVL